MGIFNYYPSNPKKLDMKLEKKIFFHSLIIPAAFVLVFWIAKIIEETMDVSFVRFGLFPRHAKGLYGILFSPFIHSGFSHLLSNSIPFFILFAALIYFYRRISYRIFFQMYLLAGICVWLFGRESWHIGASGVVYAMAAFHFVSGIIRNDVRLLTLSVTVVFLYGGLIWGMLPINPAISWEGHLWGAVSGVIFALAYRKYTLRRDKFDWEDEEEDEEEVIVESHGRATIQSQSAIAEMHDRATVQSQELKTETPETRKAQVKKEIKEENKPDNMNHTGQY